MQPDQIVSLLIANGLPGPAARVLACFADDDDELTQLDMESMARLRQPEVSVATSYLIERGWMVYSKLKREGKGRPMHLYRLAMPMREIVREIVRERTRELDAAQAMANELLQAVA